MLPASNDKNTLSLDELIYTRRSVRKYQSISPPQEWLKELINCAIQAPSPSNSQPVRFIRLASEEKKKLIHDSMSIARDHLYIRIKMMGLSKKIRNKINAYFRFSEFMFDAPWLFAVGTACTNDSGLQASLLEAGLSDKSPSDTNNDISVGLAIQSFLLKATELGLGTCILSAPLVFAPEIEKMPDFSHIKIKCFIAAGFSDETPTSPPRKSFFDIYSEI
ncbi:nitroreductase family protein [Candidatus Magnetomorum sp. HK-1]|nr:nitroreductase family protein [Candidatus Magnetomorum sp. HK-1]